MIHSSPSKKCSLRKTIYLSHLKFALGPIRHQILTFCCSGEIYFTIISLAGRLCKYSIGIIGQLQGVVAHELICFRRTSYQVPYIPVRQCELHQRKSKYKTSNLHNPRKP
ncbi:hypothetical protein FGO68_gene11306 [Halteria grandinella]|uniref:Uncharacterized protein n=1 Tax=Halteria grandinella TaxID=5974 RepID=A0A8J8NE55_HALGN|nr:hypothetical protein FGO68_gene11306 [Halteria grandinella]